MQPSKRKYSHVGDVHAAAAEMLYMGVKRQLSGKQGQHHEAQVGRTLQHISRAKENGFHLVSCLNDIASGGRAFSDEVVNNHMRTQAGGAGVTHGVQLGAQPSSTISEQPKRAAPADGKAGCNAP